MRSKRGIVLEAGGYIAGVILVAFGIAAIVMAFDGRSTVADSLKQEAIVGSPDMNPAAIEEEAAAAGLTNVTLPTCDVADEPIDTGSEAKCFASYIRVHALEASGGLTYSQLPRFATEDGAGTNDAEAALTDEDGAPVANPVRNTWVTATALSTALNTSYLAEQVALFGLVVGIALLLAGIGFLVLAAAVFHQRSVAPAQEAAPATAAVGPTDVSTA